MVTYASFFSGIGGFDLGFDRAGMECSLQVEMDDRARGILTRHWPDVPKLQDVRDVTTTDFGAATVAVGGFPCQDVSLSGKRKGLAGERSGMWFEFHRILQQNTPDWVVIENVPGLLSSNGGRDLATILHGLGKCGYLCAWRVLDSQFFGIPQRRRRVFIVGHFGTGSAAEVLFESESMSRDSDKDRKKGKQAPTLTSSGAGMSRCGGGAGAEAGFYVTVAHGINEQIDTGVCPTVKPGTQSVVAGSMVTYSTPAIGIVKEDDVAMTMQAASGGRGESQNPAYVVQAQPITDGRAIPDGHTLGVRRLTPVECCRLQGFPDDWNDGQPDGPRYKQLGNAVSVPVAQWIGRRLVAAQVKLDLEAFPAPSGTIGGMMDDATIDIATNREGLTG